MILDGKYAVNSELSDEQAFEIQTMLDGLTARIKRPWRSQQRVLWILVLGAVIAAPGALLLLRHPDIWTFLLFVVGVVAGQTVSWAVDRNLFKTWNTRRQAAICKREELVQQLTDEGRIVDISPLAGYVFDEEVLPMDRLLLALDLHDAVTHERATVEKLRPDYEQGRLSAWESRDYLVATDVSLAFTRAVAEALQ